MNFSLRIWRQEDRKSKGRLVDYEARDISPDTSFLEMLDIVNDELTERGEAPVAFDSDCREGICGTTFPHPRARWDRAASPRRCGAEQSLRRDSVG